MPRSLLRSKRLPRSQLPRRPSNPLRIQHPVVYLIPPPARQALRRLSELTIPGKLESEEDYDDGEGVAAGEGCGGYVIVAGPPSEMMFAGVGHGEVANVAVGDKVDWL